MARGRETEEYGQAEELQGKSLLWGVLRAGSIAWRMRDPAKTCRN